MVWNFTGLRVSEKIICNESSRSSKSSFTGCLELVSSPWWCLKPVGCESMRHAVCEWRGDSIQSFGAHLESQLVNAYVAVFAVLALFSLIWSSIYALSRAGIHANIELARRNYQIQLELFSNHINNKTK